LLFAQPGAFRPGKRYFFQTLPHTCAHGKLHGATLPSRQSVVCIRWRPSYKDMCFVLIHSLFERRRGFTAAQRMTFVRIYFVLIFLAIIVEANAKPLFQALVSNHIFQVDRLK
jgi:hypothetical protein